jgi:hypothetical protein
MGIYLVSRADRIGYDEYVGFVVRASSPEHARAICKNYSEDFRDNNTVVKDVLPYGETEVILSAFRAG